MLFQPVDRCVEEEAALPVSQRTRRQKTKSGEAPAEPLTYREVESNSDPEPLIGQVSAQTRIEIYALMRSTPG